jgi:AcrR family transcriptional regulator
MSKPSDHARTTGTRERILEVAAEMISEGGMERLRLKDVAERVGIRPPSVFAHFDGREAIGDAVAARIVEQIAGVISNALAESGSPEERVRTGVRAFAAHLWANPAHARMLMRDLARTRRAGELDIYTPLVDVIQDQVARLLAEGESAGVFRKIDPHAFIAQIQGAVLGRIGWAGFHEDGRPAADLAPGELEAQTEDLALGYIRNR